MGNSVKSLKIFTKKVRTLDVFYSPPTPPHPRLLVHVPPRLQDSSLPDWTSVG